MATAEHNVKKKELKGKEETDLALILQLYKPPHKAHTALETHI